MTDKQLFTTAMDNLAKNMDIKGEWKPVMDKDLDGKIDLWFEDEHHLFFAEARQDLRMPALPQLDLLKKKYKKFIVITDRLTPRIKKELRERNINYLEANGNVFFKNKQTLLWLDTNEPLQKNDEKKTGRAFTKTGLKVVFEFLLNEVLINQTYRQIAAYTGTGIGNITNIMTDLKKEGFLLTAKKGLFRLHNKKALLDRWIEAYANKLQPALQMGAFRFLKEDDFRNWETLPLNYDKNWWGGEPAGKLLTQYLKPAELTLYTWETRTDLIKHYRLLPDEQGNVKVYERFWKFHEVNYNVTPALLIYADLINTHDPRCIETANKLYEAYLQEKF